MHISDGELRAYYDHELNEAKQKQVRAHLSACAECQKEADKVFARAQRMPGYFAALPLPSETLPSVKSARPKLRARLSELPKERITMLNLFQRYRAAWAGLAAVLLLALALTFPSVRALANDFLGLFRVQQITIVEFDPDNVGDVDTSALPGAPVLSDNIQTEAIGEKQEVSSAAEASEVAGIPVRLPTSVEQEPTLTVQAGSNVTLELDVERMSALLAAVGQENIDLPDSLDGATVTANLPQAVTAGYGAECETEEGDKNFREGDKKFSELSEAERRELRAKARARFRERDCTVFIQVSSPTVEAPAELPVADLGAAFLQVVAGMSAEDAAQMSEEIDWSTTLMLPIPTGKTEHSKESVDGVDGTLIQDTYSGYTLIWINNDIVYAIHGDGDASEAIEMANSLQ